ncbi:MAG: ABC transporter substrate-binding protein [Candidatus Wallbacteria bacterium]|nr:ABC transporter substrate-binding protein [Candidatus Wallbacteria bacterium]
MRWLVIAALLAGAAWTARTYVPGTEAPGGSAVEGPVVGGIYHAALSTNPPTFDPALATDTTSVFCLLQMFDGLVKFDLSTNGTDAADSQSQGSITSAVAESWDISSDGLVYTFHLSPKVTFHATSENGRPTANGGRRVTASDVKFSFERVLDPLTESARAQIFSVIEGAEEFRAGKTRSVRGLEAITLPKAAESRHAGCSQPCTIRIRLTSPYAPFLATLTMSNAFIVPKEDVLKWGKDFRNHPVGTGAFRFESFAPNAKVVLSRNPAYFGGPPYLDRVEFHIIAEEDALFGEFLAGRIYHSSVPDKFYTQVKRSGSIWAPFFTEVSQLGTYYFGMNAKIPPFDNPLVRRAFSHAVDKTSIVKFIKTGRVQEARGPLPPGIRGYNASLRSYDFDLKQADALLTQAGFPRSRPGGLRQGFPEIPIHIPEGEDHIRITRAIQAGLADLGIAAYPVVNSWKTHLDLTKRGKAGFFRLGWVADYMDADNFLYYQFYSKNVGSSNSVSYENAEVDSLLVQARRETNPLLRIKLYQKAEQLIVDDAVWICIFYFNTAIVRQPFVHGINLTPLGDQLIGFRNVWLAQGAGEPPPLAVKPEWSEPEEGSESTAPLTPRQERRAPGAALGGR